jgi:hypothetical protein
LTGASHFKNAGRSALDYISGPSGRRNTRRATFGLGAKCCAPLAGALQQRGAERFDVGPLRAWTPQPDFDLRQFRLRFLIFGATVFGFDAE